jgi:hypothetical protein
MRRNEQRLRSGLLATTCCRNDIRFSLIGCERMETRKNQSCYLRVANLVTTLNFISNLSYKDKETTPAS